MATSALPGAKRMWGIRFSDGRVVMLGTTRTIRRHLNDRLVAAGRPAGWPELAGRSAGGFTKALIAEGVKHQAATVPSRPPKKTATAADVDDEPPCGCTGPAMMGR